MNAQVIPDFVGPKSEISREAASIDILWRHSDIDITDLAAMVQADATSAFLHIPSDLKSIFSNHIVSFEGSENELFAKIKTAKVPNFLVLLNLGKVGNHLKSPFHDADLSSMIMFGRMNAFAKRLGNITGKEVKVTIAAENEFLDTNVLGRNGYRNGVVDVTMQITKELGLKNVEFINLTKLLGKVDGYMDEFFSVYENLKDDIDRLKMTPEFTEPFKVFYYSSPTKSFASAVETYCDKDKRIGEWATERTLRYLSFLKARANLHFWDANDEYLRATVSKKPGSVAFEYQIGRMTAAHGISLSGVGGSVNTEYFYDVVNSAPRIKGKEVQLDAVFYNGRFMHLKQAIR